MTLPLTIGAPAETDPSEPARDAPADGGAGLIAGEQVVSPVIRRRGPTGSRRAPRGAANGFRSVGPEGAVPHLSEEVYRGFDRGDEGDVGTVFRFWYARVVEYVEFSFQVRFEDAKDIAQQTFIRALRSKPEHRVVPVPARLFALARYEALEHCRKAKRRASRLDHYTVSVGSPPPLPDEVVHRWMQFDAIVATVRTFPEPEYTAFVWRRIYGYSYAEIGELLGWSTQRTTDVVHQTWRRLQRLLGIERTT